MTTRLSSEMKKATEESLIGDNIQKTTKILEKIYLGRIPIMLQSEFCVLHGLTPEVRFSMVKVNKLVLFIIQIIMCVWISPL